MTCKDCIHNDLCEALEMNGLAKVHPKQCGFYTDQSRYIELPCKLGDKVYCVSDIRIEEATATEFFMHGDDFNVELETVCDYDCKGCPFNSWAQEYSGEYSCQGEYGVWHVNKTDFGKTVFLTKEEAEKALAERAGNGT